MGNRGGKKKGAQSNSGQYTQMCIREEVSGKKKTNSLKSIMKLQHLQNLAIWAVGDASIPSLCALFGRRFAATGEALGIPPDPSLFPCQRCETILQTGFNCTVRVVKNQAKLLRQEKKLNAVQQNSVAYKCHFCSYANLKRGTPKGHMKENCPPTPKQPSKLKSAQLSAPNKQDTALDQDTRYNPEVEKTKELASLTTVKETSSVAGIPSNEKGIASAQHIADKLEREKTEETASLSPSTVKETSSFTVRNPSTPPEIKGLALLDSKKTKRSKAKPKKLDELEANLNVEVTSSKKRRKGWTTLREIVENNERERNKAFTHISIPFTL